MSFHKQKRKIIVMALLLATIPITQGSMNATELKTCYLSVQMEMTTLRELFDLIQAKFNYSFLIRNNNINLNERIAVDMKNHSVEEILTNALKNQGATFEVKDNKIIVYKKEASNEKKATPDAKGIDQQQTRKVSGTVLDQTTGEPVIGANVTVDGTNIGTMTDLEGKFTLEIPVNASLTISYVGYIRKEVKPTGNTVDIRLSEDMQALDEIVVVGYGTQRKESLTGSLQTLKSEKLTDITTPSVENMLNGKVPGVYVTPGTGQPGSTGAVVIRGKTTISGSMEPLWVIDGVIVGSSSGALNPADIETMTILKDAASTAIYGSQGANGVIIVTTKRAKTEKLTINVSAKLGITNLNKGNLEMMNGAELYDYFNSFPNSEQINFKRWTPELRNSNFDWWDLASQTGFAEDYNLSISGGNEKQRSYFSVGVYDENGAVKGYDYTRYNFRYKTDYKPFEWLTIKPSISGAYRNVDDKQYDVSAMYSMLPWDSPYDKDGNIVGHYSSDWVNSNSTNYLYDLQWNHSGSKNYEFMGNFDFDIRITDWLSFSSVNNYRFQTENSNSYSDPRSSSASGVNGRIQEDQYTVTRRYTNQIMRFTKTWGKHSVNALAAYEFNDYRYKTVQAIGTGFVPGYDQLDIASLPEKVGGSITEWAVQSYIFNANYDYNNRYLAQVSFRRDGASNFGDNSKYGNFFSVSGGWNIHNESFFKVDWVDALKIRASYGSVGNRPSSLYPQYDLYSLDKSYNGVPGALISQVGNKDLTWEKTYTTGVGIDVSLFNRVRLSADYYNKKTDNILYQVPVSGVTGVTSIWQNVGEMTNRGFEATVGVDIINTKDWYWNVEANIGLNRNKLDKLYQDKDQIIVSDGSGIAGAAQKLLKPGVDSDSWYLREWAGVDTETGAPLWYKTVTDANGNKTRQTTDSYAEADEVICGTYNPDFYGGFSTALTWKQFDLNAVFGYSVGGSIYNYARSEYDSDGTYTDRNQLKLQDGWSRWEKPGDKATHPLATYENKTNSNKSSSRFLEDADYLKLRSLTIGYTVPLKDSFLSNLRVYLSGENLFCITDYSGVDPEIPVNSSTGKISGVPATPYPSTRKFMFGLNITF